MTKVREEMEEKKQKERQIAEGEITAYMTVRDA